ncbi:MAG TPA: Zn-ribbon domain-containing OB-fold protein [Quisquiliibacterium sp.]|nr:Zn-ribbon domain-containing OB-fold protein [Quisquiliibacterium sp.]
MSETTNTIGFEQDAYAAAYPETRPFWEASAEGRLLVKACRACGRAHWYPKVVCPFCHSADLEWREASGRGTIYTYSVMRRVEVPYVLAYVTLEEGPTLMTNIVDCDVDSVRIGQSVRVRFRQAPQGRTVPVFAPA